MTPQPSEPGAAGASGADRPSAPEPHLERVLDLIRFLRVHCPWDARQTAESLLPHLLEEAHEVAAAVRAGSPPAALAAELGDLLLNVGYQIVVAEEAGGPDAESVTAALEAKMVRRHPHVDWSAYPGALPETAATALPEPAASDLPASATTPAQAPGPDALAEVGPAAPSGVDAGGSAAAWERRKLAERGPEASALDGVPAALEPLTRAYRVQERAAAVGFDWSDTDGPAAKVAEELDEVREALADGPANRVADELGDLLFAVVNLARRAGVHPSTALPRATAKFERRFRQVEAALAASGRTANALSLAELDEIWDDVKRKEGAPDG